MKYTIICMVAIAANALFLNFDWTMVFVGLAIYIVIDMLENIQEKQREILSIITPQEYPSDIL